MKNKSLFVRTATAVMFVLSASSGAEAYYDWFEPQSETSRIEPYLALRGYGSMVDIGNLSNELGDAYVNHYWDTSDQEVADDDGDLDTVWPVNWGDNKIGSPGDKEYPLSLAIAVGASFSNNLRLELELRKSSKISFSETLFEETEKDGEVYGLPANYEYAAGISYTASMEMEVYMVNLIYDFRSPEEIGSFVPFVGIGLGMASIDSLLKIADSPPLPQEASTDRTEASVIFPAFYDTNGYFITDPYNQQNFAWSLMAGFTKELSETTSFEMGAKYSNFGKVKWAMHSDGEGSTVEDTRNVMKTEDDLTSIDIFFGFRFGF